MSEETKIYKRRLRQKRKLLGYKFWWILPLGWRYKR